MQEWVIMKKLIINLAIIAGLLVNSSLLLAQLVSSPLEPGLYSFLKESTSSESYSITLVDDAHLLMARTAGSATVSIENVAPDNIVISGVVATLVIQNEGVLRDLQRKIDDYNFSAPIGTLRLDPQSGVLVMEHRLNPKNVGPAAMAKAAVRFYDVLVRLQQRFTEKLA
jgi:hypothetical protein